MDAENIVGELRLMAYDLGHSSVQHMYLPAVEEAAKWIEAQTRPLTLDECRRILNEHEYCFDQEDWNAESPWECGSEHSGLIFSRGTFLTLFEATCLARGFLAQGGAA